MQSDTLIGIVGAVVLVAVMVGVFAYEYNNTAADGGDGDLNGDMDAFNETYPFLAAADDIDMDGTANWEDDDLDGDGTSNAEDELVEVSFDASGSAPANTNPVAGADPDATEFVVGTGNNHIHVLVEYSTGTSGQSRLAAGVTGPDDVGSCTDSGGAGECEIAQTAAVVAGGYTLNVRQSQLNPQALSYTGTITVTYGP